mmetsp:Transcript_115828/g.327683  ORF Transcript_115828/g.327683 Transcript_115828/m.327683 type:complete len:218 (-) Transcript_115828:87-740(-)
MKRNFVKSLNATKATAAKKAKRVKEVKRARAATGLKDIKRPSNVRVLSLAAPELAMAILAKQKTVENRSWPIPKSFVGKWLALHVGIRKSPDWIVKHVAKAWDPTKAVNTPWRSWDPASRDDEKLLPRAAIVGLIRVKGTHWLQRGEKRENPWALGPCCWDIDRVVPLDPPIHGVSGKLGLWRARKELTNQKHARLTGAILHAQQRRGYGALKPRTV